MNSSFTARNFPLIVFSSTWIVTLTLFALNPYNIRPLSETTTLIIFLSVLSVILGILISSIIFNDFFLSLKRPSKNLYFYKFDSKNILKLLKISIVFTIIGIFFELIVIDQISGNIIEYFSNPILGRKIYVESITNSIKDWNIFQSIANYFLDFNYFSSILAGAYLSISSNKKKYSFIPIFLALLISIITFQRFFFVQNFSIWLFSIIIISNVLSPKLQKNALKLFYKTFITVGIFFLVFSFALISLRATFGKENINIEKISEYVVKSNYLYVAGNLGGLNNYIDKNENKPMKLGSSTFRGVEKWLARFGAIESNEVMGSNYEFTKVAKGWVNTYSFMRIFYEDFGFIGVIILSFLWGFVGNLLFNRIIRKFSFLLLYFVSMFLFSYFLSFYSFAFTAFTMHIFLAAIIIFFENIVNKPKNFYKKINPELLYLKPNNSD